MVSHRKDRTARVKYFRAKVQALSVEIENTRNEQHLILSKLHHGSDAFAAFRYSKQYSFPIQQHSYPQQTSGQEVSSAGGAVKMVLPPSSAEDRSPRNDKDERKSTSTGAALPSPRTNYEGEDDETSTPFGDFARVGNAGLKLHRFRQGVVLQQEDKIRSILSRMKDRMQDKGEAGVMREDVDLTASIAYSERGDESNSI